MPHSMSGGQSALRLRPIWGLASKATPTRCISIWGDRDGYLAEMGEKGPPRREEEPRRAEKSRGRRGRWGLPGGGELEFAGAEEGAGVEGVVGGDLVDAAQEELLHLFGFVHCPDIGLETLLVEVLDEGTLD